MLILRFKNRLEDNELEPVGKSHRKINPARQIVAEQQATSALVPPLGGGMH